jgi:phosphoribosylformylglycinamidine synthase
MKNDYAIGDTRISIPPTLLVTAIGILDDAQLAVTMDSKQAGDAVYVVGTTYPDLGASEYFDQLDLKGGAVPKLRDPAATKQLYRLLHRAMKARLVSSCHDVSDGGLGVALAECAFAGALGLVVDLREVPSCGELNDDEVLFSESPARFVITVPQSSTRAFETLMGETTRQVGYVSEDKRLVLTGRLGEAVVDADIFELEAAWKKPLCF